MSRPMLPDDPAWSLVGRVPPTTPEVYDARCYICADPEFAMLGMPLCKPCDACRQEGRGIGHVPADDEECSVCGWNIRLADAGST